MRAAEGESITSIVVPVQLKRCGLAVRLIVRAPTRQDAITGPSADCIVGKSAAVVRRSWAQGAGQRAVDRAGARHGQREVTRVVYLAFLAPDIVERIVRGEQPIGLDIKRLLAMSPLPMDWAEQRRVLGFDG